MKNRIYILTFLALNIFTISYSQDECTDLTACNYGLAELCWYANDGCACSDGENAQLACDQICYALDDSNAPTLDCAGVCDTDPSNDSSDVDSDGICDDDEVLGCSDINACNYNNLATEDDESCEYPEENFDCEGNCIATGDTLDEFGLDCAGKCGGDSIEDCLGDCDGPSSLDECGVCNGPGDIYQCGCYEILEGYCDCEGAVEDEFLFPDCAGVCHPSTAIGQQHLLEGLEYGSLIDECVYSFNGASTEDCIFGGSSNPEWNAKCTGCNQIDADNYEDGCEEEYSCIFPAFNCEYTSSNPPGWY